MSGLTDRLERDLREIAAGADPSPSAWNSVMAQLGDVGESEVALVIAPAPERWKRSVRIAVAAAALVVITASAAAFFTADRDATTDPSDTPPSTAIDVGPTIPPTIPPFVGIWVSTDTDGSSQTMEIVTSGGVDYEFFYRDAFATACSGAPATIIGIGRLETDGRLVFAQPELTCDDGTVSGLGPAPQVELANFTLELDTAADEFVDPFGIVWRRADPTDEPIASSGDAVPTFASATSGGMWPQSTLAEVRAAQELADASDPAATWQLYAPLATDGPPWGAEIFARFIREGLGWEEYVSGSSFSGYAGEQGTYEGILFIRCALGQRNPLSDLYADAPPEIRGCAPTIDDLTYETVSFAVTQPEVRGPSGIWVVQRWERLQTKATPGSLWGIMFPDNFGEFQVEQFVPPSDAEVAALLQAFLQARVNGEGAEQYLLREPEGSWAEDREVPLLYATTGGAPYVRSEIQRVEGPVWPNGLMEYKVQLFAQDETLVEQYLHVIRHDGQLRLVYGYTFDSLPTTENGVSVPVPYSLLDGDVTFAVAPPLDPRVNETTYMGFDSGRYGRVMIAADPRPGDAQGCEEVPTSADAEALARLITADSNFETTATVPVRIAGLDGLQMDVTFRTSDNYCYFLWAPDQIPVDGSGLFRMRLYLIDYPGESAQVLTLAIIAPETDFESLLEEATPIVESLEFHTE